MRKNTTAAEPKQTEQDKINQFMKILRQNIKLPIASVSANSFVNKKKETTEK